MAEIKVLAKLIPTPKKPANIYRLSRPRVSDRSVSALARQFGMRADAKSGRFCSDADKITYAERHLELTINRASGGIRFIDRSRWQIDDRKSDLRIEDAAARRLATNLIKKYKLAQAAEMKFLKASRLRVGVATKNGEQASERTIDVAIAMQRIIDKIPVDGPGGKIVVYLNHEGELTGLEMIWREIGGIHRRNQAHRSPQSAIEEMAAHFKTKHGIIEVQAVRYGYFEDDRHTDQRYLQPAYIIFGLLGTSDGGSRKKTIYVAPALANPLGRITPPLRRKSAQKPRRSAR
ncbi:MAG TPA: hypothetical protein VGI45_24760 [Terracidiphilus sp.]|jgi:hypothetical protein